MLQPTDHEWRNRVALAEESDSEASQPTAVGSGHRCPVCEFASAEYDDVYAHLMTAHRKSTISAALLRP